MSTNWVKTQLAYEMGNDNYPKGKKIRRFNNINKNVSEADINAFGAILADLSAGDVHQATQKIEYTEILPTDAD